jgi:hypothetical protein
MVVVCKKCFDNKKIAGLGGMTIDCPECMNKPAKCVRCDGLQEELKMLTDEFEALKETLMIKRKYVKRKAKSFD